MKTEYRFFVVAFQNMNRIKKNDHRRKKIHKASNNNNNNRKKICCLSGLLEYSRTNNDTKNFNFNFFGYMNENEKNQTGIGFLGFFTKKFFFFFWMKIDWLIDDAFIFRGQNRIDAGRNRFENRKWKEKRPNNQPSKEREIHFLFFSFEDQILNAGNLMDIYLFPVIFCWC